MPAAGVLLARMVAVLYDMHQEQRKFHQQQGRINERLTTAIERLEVTQARIEALLARMIAHGENGRDV